MDASLTTSPQAGVRSPGRTMNVKTIPWFGLFEPAEVKCFAQAIKHDRFYFVTEQQSEEINPKDIFAFQLTNNYYSKVLDDPDGHFKCFLLCFKGPGGQLLRFTMGIFGVSPKNKIRFPVLLGGTILNFLTMSDTVFEGYLYKNKPSEKNQRIKWERLYNIKKQLIKRVLLFYTQMEDDYSSAMAWKSRGEDSITRQVGERLPGYVRTEDGFGTEYYYEKDLSGHLVPYLVESFGRFNPRDAKKGPPVEHQLSEQFKLLLSLFIKQLVSTPIK